MARLVIQNNDFIKSFTPVRATDTRSYTKIFLMPDDFTDELGPGTPWEWNG